MEALAISAANLNTIEDNLGAVANELSGVINNVNSMRDQFVSVEGQVQNLNDELKGMMKEIRETSFITNARQNIMYNNQINEKEFGYRDNVRRTMLSLLEAVLNTSISRKKLIDLRQEILLNNPNYWLSYALSSIICWILDDRKNSLNDLNIALRLNNNKTSIFMSFVNLKFKRVDTAQRWIRRYLSNVNPLDMNMEFVTIMDSVAAGLFGDETKALVLKYINKWINDIQGIEAIRKKQSDLWIDYILNHSKEIKRFPYLDNYISESNVIFNNLLVSSSYDGVLADLQGIETSHYSNIDINDVLKKLVFSYEEKELDIKKDNLRNQLLIECNGDKEEATRLFDKQKEIYEENIDIITLLSNIVLYKDEYKVCDEVQKVALALLKDNLLYYLDLANQGVVNKPVKINVDEFSTTSLDGKNYDEVKKDLDIFLNNKYQIDDKNSLLVILCLNLLFVVMIVLSAINNLGIISIVIGIFLFIGDLIWFAKFNKKNNINNAAKGAAYKKYQNVLDNVLADLVDYNTVLSNNNDNYKALVNYLNNLDPLVFIKGNDERNIELGE